MSRCTRQFALVLLVATVIASLGSHLVAGWLRIKTKASELFTFGSPNGKPPAFRAGSSLADYGISWERVATQLDLEIKAWGIAAGSPYEWEQFQMLVPEARTTFIVVSAYDLDEANVCDFRANLVPLSHTIQTLRAMHADWHYSKRALSQYPMTWLRTLFPTLGRSRGIMGKLRENVVHLIRPARGQAETEAGPTLEVGTEKGIDSYRQQRVSDWPASQIIGKLAAVREGFQNDHAFHGPKGMAFDSMLQYGCQKGLTIVIVMPVSPTYAKAFMSPELVHEFEAALGQAERDVPGAEWLRLDRVPGLGSDENFCDLVHMNAYGQKTATAAFQVWLKQVIPKS